MFNAFEKNILQRHPNEWKHTQYDRYSRQAAFLCKKARMIYSKVIFYHKELRVKTLHLFFSYILNIWKDLV